MRIYAVRRSQFTDFAPEKIDVAAKFLRPVTEKSRAAETSVRASEKRIYIAVKFRFVFRRK